MHRPLKMEPTVTLGLCPSKGQQISMFCQSIKEREDHNCFSKSANLCWYNQVQCYHGLCTSYSKKYKQNSSMYILATSLVVYQRNKSMWGLFVGCLPNLLTVNKCYINVIIITVVVIIILISFLPYTSTCFARILGERDTCGRNWVRLPGLSQGEVSDPSLLCLVWQLFTLSYTYDC